MIIVGLVSAEKPRDVYICLLLQGLLQRSRRHRALPQKAQKALLCGLLGVQHAKAQK